VCGCLVVRAAGAVVGVVAHGSPGSVHDDQVFAGRLQSSAGHPADGRREEHLERHLGTCLVWALWWVSLHESAGWCARRETGFCSQRILPSQAPSSGPIQAPTHAPSAFASMAPSTMPSQAPSAICFTASWLGSIGCACELTNPPSSKRCHQLLDATSPHPRHVPPTAHKQLVAVGPWLLRPERSAVAAGLTERLVFLRRLHAAHTPLPRVDDAVDRLRNRDGWRWRTPRTSSPLASILRCVECGWTT
jgi:hypothetical protein